jgi:hypothetical protein
VEVSVNPQFKPQELYLLERYSSTEYFEELRDVWAELVNHVSSCLDKFMQDLPSNYRSAALSEQPDVAWGRRVLPNFRNTLQNLIKGYILLSHGDVAGLGYAHGPLNDHKGQYDFSTDWMSAAQLDRYENLLQRATNLAGNICATEGAYWRPGNLIANFEQYSDESKAPATWPAYQVNRSLNVRTGTRTAKSGIYVPDLDNSSPEFLSTEYQQAPLAYVIVGFRDLLDPGTGEKYGVEPILEKRSCTWYLVERCTDQMAEDASSIQFEDQVRVDGGAACPRDGYYFTPARPGSRRFFAKGDTMPFFATGYGTTIWQWAAEQGDETNR